MIETKEKQIGGDTYFLTQLPAGKGRKVMTRFIKVAAPLVAAIQTGTPVGTAMQVACQALTDEDFDFVCNTFSEATRVQFKGGQVRLSDDGIFDLHFAGKYDLMLEWLQASMEINFSSFFKVASAKVAAAGAA